MIYTITVNPTIDVTNILKKHDRIEAKTHRPETQLRHAGGKGIDVSRVVRNLGGRSVAMGFLGGFTGELVLGLLLEEGLECDFVSIRQETRTNVIIITKDPKDPKRNLDYRFNSPGPQVQPFESLELYKKIERLDHREPKIRPTYAAVCGSLCYNMKPTFYVNILRYFKRMGAVVALDSSGQALKEALRYAPRPDIIKPNLEEFFELMEEPLGEFKIKADECGINRTRKAGLPSENWRRLFSVVNKFRQRYPGVDALITLGEGGALLLHKSTLLHARNNQKLKPKVINTVGAGDSTLAGFLFTLESKKTWEEALIMGISAGSAAVEHEGTESPSRDEVFKFSKNIEYHEHSMV